MFLYIYVDYLALYKPGVIDDLRAGGAFEFDIGPTLLTIFVAVIAIPALMVWLSMDAARPCESRHATLSLHRSTSSSRCSTR